MKLWKHHCDYSLTQNSIRATFFCLFVCLGWVYFLNLSRFFWRFIPSSASYLLLVVNGSWCSLKGAGTLKIGNPFFKYSNPLFGSGWGSLWLELYRVISWTAILVCILHKWHNPSIHSGIQPARLQSHYFFNFILPVLVCLTPYPFF